jgi:hypothetical protein
MDEKLQCTIIIANRCRAIDWLPQTYSEAPVTDQNHFRFILRVKVNVAELITRNTNAIPKPQIVMNKNLPVQT